MINIQATSATWTIEISDDDIPEQLMGYAWKRDVPQPVRQEVTAIPVVEGQEYPRHLAKPRDHTVTREVVTITVTITETPAAPDWKDLHLEFILQPPRHNPKLPACTLRTVGTDRYFLGQAFDPELFIEHQIRDLLHEAKAKARQ